MERLDDGTLFVTDFPGNRILRVDRAGRSSVVAQVAAPADLVVDPAGQTIWVASIAPGIGVVRVDVASGRVEPFASVEAPHGIDRDAAGNFYVHDGHAISRIDGNTGAVSRFADVDGIKLLVAPDGSVYGVVGSPAGGRVVRVAPDGSATTVAGTGSLGPHRDGPALEAGILPSAVQFAPDGSLIVTQVEPIPAIRLVDRPGGTITTLARGRRRLVRKRRPRCAVERCDVSSSSGVQRERERGAHLMANPQASHPRAAELRQRGRGAPRRRLSLPALHDRKPTPRRRSRRRDVRARTAALAPLRPEARLGANLALPACTEHGARPLPRRAASTTAGGHVLRRRARVGRAHLRRRPLARRSTRRCEASRPPSARSSCCGSCSSSTARRRRACSGSGRARSQRD